MRDSLGSLWKSSEFRFATGGYIAFTFAFGALAAWMPYYMQSVRGWSVASSTLTFGIVVLASGFTGTLAGGWIARRLGGGSRACLILCGACMIAAAPCSLFALYCESDAAILAGLAAASTFSFATQGPVNAVILNAVAASLRPFAVGASVLLIHLLGDVPSPMLVGSISDGGAGMPTAMVLIPIAMVISAGAWLWGGMRTRVQR